MWFPILKRTSSFSSPNALCNNNSKIIQNTTNRTEKSIVNTNRPSSTTEHSSCKMEIVIKNKKILLKQNEQIIDLIQTTNLTMT